jgi:hypothetical protein
LGQHRATLKRMVIRMDEDRRPALQLVRLALPRIAGPLGKAVVAFATALLLLSVWGGVWIAVGETSMAARIAWAIWSAVLLHVISGLWAGRRWSLVPAQFFLICMVPASAIPDMALVRAYLWKFPVETAVAAVVAISSMPLVAAYLLYHVRERFEERAKAQQDRTSNR